MLKCEICGDSKLLKTKTKNNKYGKILCNRHYKQLQKHGKILPRTRYDKNEIEIIDENHAKMYLYDKNGLVIAFCLLDIEDIEKIADLKWSIRDKQYMYVRNDKSKVYLHRYLINASETDIVDHINRNVLDNRKANLRIVSPSENAHNTSLRKDNTSSIIGVSYISKLNKWDVRISVHGKQIYIGAFEDFQTAIKARLQAEKKYFGEEFAPQRDMFQKYGI